MKLQVSKSLTDNPSGPGIFISRLMQILSIKYGVKIVERKADVYLTGMTFEKPAPCSRVVYRVDGCYYDKSVHMYHHRNKAIKKGIKSHQGVIYQSLFSQQLTKAILGVFNSNSTIINNGFDQSVIERVQPIGKNCKWLFVSSAKWRVTKRPQSIINGFLEANIPDSKLVLLGDGESLHPRITYTGFQPQSEVFKYYKAADAMIHMCFLDSCSNSVVEGLSFGMPVICNNTGGTPELVGKDGIIIKCDSYDFGMVNKVEDNIPPNLIAEALHKFVQNPFRVSRPDLDINVIADKYYKFLTDIANDKRVN